MVSTIRPRANEIDKIFAHRKYVDAIGESKLSDNKKEVVQGVTHTRDEVLKETGFKNLAEFDRTKLVEEFSSEPMEEYIAKFIGDDVRFSLNDAYQVNLTKYIELDALWRYLNAGDLAINIRGRPNSSKSNAMLYLAMVWAYITKVPLRMSNIVYDKISYNGLLKGYKFFDKPGGVSIEDFEQERGMSLCLDEASDTMKVGQLSSTVQTQTESIEQRMRAQQISRICAGVGEVLHQAYYSIYMVRRVPKERCGYGVVYTHESTSKDSPTMWLGYVRIPYVPQATFEVYNKSKMKSIYNYAHGGGSNRIAQLIDTFAKELWVNEEYQMLPIKPPEIRQNYITMNPRYNVFTTISYIRQLETLSRNIALNKELMGKIPEIGTESESPTETV